MKKIVSFILLVSLFTFNSASALSNEYLSKKAEKTMLNFNNSLDKLIEKNKLDKSIALINKLEKNINSMTGKLLTQCQKQYPGIKDYPSFVNFPDSIQNKSCYNFGLLAGLLFGLSFKKEAINFEKSIVPIFENKADGIVLKTFPMQNIHQENQEFKPENAYEFEKINNIAISKDSKCTLYEAGSSDPLYSLNISNGKNIAKQNSFINTINETKNYLILQSGTGFDDYLSYSSLFIHSTFNGDMSIFDKYSEALNGIQNDGDLEKVKKYEDIITKNTEIAENINREKIIQKYNLKLMTKARMRVGVPVFYEFVKFKGINGGYGVLECTNPKN